MKLDIQRFAVTYTGPEVVGNYSWAKIQGRVTCEETYVGTSAENKSTVKCTVEVRCTTGGTQAANWRMGVTCNGVEKTAKSTYNMTVDSNWKVINTVVFENVPHNEDGSKVVAISGYAQAPEYATSLGNAKSSFSGNMTLTTIPRESSISADKTSLTLDETVRISINRKSSTFYEDLLITYVSGDTGKTTTETVKVTNTYYDLKLTSDKFKNITGPSGAIYITAITYDASGNRVAQTNQVGVSVTVPNTMVPTLTVGDLYEDGTIVPSSWGVFVKGKSEIGVPVNASGINGSTIKSITMRDSNNTGEYVMTGSSGIFSTAKVVADGTLTITATDSRDKTAKVTKNYTVVDYSDPKLTEYKAKKVNGNNIEDENGQYVMFSVDGTISSCGGNNVKKLYVAINNQTNWIDVTDYPTNNTITTQTIDPNAKNVVHFKITDSLGGSDIKSAELDGVFKLMNFNKTLTSVAIGKKSSAADDEKLFEIGMTTRFGEEIYDKNGKEILGGGGVTSTDLLNLIYPVGSIYMSVREVSPQTFLGGSWRKIEGKFLLSASSTFPAGTSGGNKDAVVVAHTHTLSGSAVSNGAHTHTVNGTAATGGSHSHNVGRDRDCASGSANWSVHTAGVSGAKGTSPTSTHDGHTHTVTGTAESNGAHTHTLSGTATSTGVSGTNANMPPYLSVHMWERIA